MRLTHPRRQFLSALQPGRVLLELLAEVRGAVVTGVALKRNKVRLTKKNGLSAAERARGIHLRKDGEEGGHVLLLLCARLLGVGDGHGVQEVPR